MKQGFIFVLQIAFLWLINEISYKMVEFFHIPIPGNVLGMVILFILLLTGAVNIRWVEKGASFLNKHLAFFFIPISVGFMSYGNFFVKNGLALAVVLLGSSIIGLLITGYTSQWLGKEKEGNVNEDRHYSI
ncbi:MAG: CidA/LrgA family protein [Bacillales bacterium]|nr:CidA/LrgA family protein [Bacillales bacterium]